MKLPDKSTSFQATDFKAVFESAPWMYLVLDTHFTIVTASNAYLQATMTARETLIGRNLLEVNADSNTHYLRASLERVTHSKQADKMAVQRYNIRRAPSEGGGMEERYWRASNSPIVNEEGAVTYIIHHIEDVTEVTKTYAQLDTSRNFLQNIIDSVADPIFVKDQYHRLIEGNEALWKLLGRPAKEVIGKSDYDFFPKEEADIFWQKDQEVFMSNDVNLNIENFTDASGKTHVVSTKKACFTMPSGEKILVGVIRDMTDVKEMQDKLKESNEARLKSIMDHSGRMVYIKDLEGRYLQANALFLEMIGRTEEEAIGKTNYDFFPKEYADMYQQNDLRVIATGRSYEFEQVTPQGDVPHTYMAVKFPLYDIDNKMYAICGITSDITERKQTELRLQQTMEKLKESNSELEAYRNDLERSNKDLERFATVVAHDLKSPLRAISQHLELIRANKNNALEARSLTSMGFVIDGAVRMRELIEALLEYSHMGFSEKMLGPVDCNQVLAIARDNLSSFIQEKSAILTNDPLPTVTADKIQLMQLFENLIANAIKFCTTTPRIHVRAVREAEHWTFAIQDNGIGIAAHNLENVFLIFKRVHGEDEYAGAGVGLAICERVVKNHAGEIWVESEIGKGATFFFTLPA